MWCVKHFLNKSAAVLMASRQYLKNKKAPEKPEGILSSWMEVVNDLLEMYATQDVIAETGMEMRNFDMSSNMTPTVYTEALWTETLRYSQVYTEYAIQGIFGEELAKLHLQQYAVKL